MSHLSLSSIWFEDALISLLRSNVAVAIPLFILLLKLVVLRISGDLEELFRSLVAIPLISIGLIFAGLGRTIPFETRLGSDRSIDLHGTVLVLIISGCLALLYRVNKALVIYMQKFFAAMDSIRIPVAQANFEFKGSGTTAWKTAWAVGYLMSSALMWVTEMGVSVFFLWQTFLRLR